MKYLFNQLIRGVFSHLASCRLDPQSKQKLYSSGFVSCVLCDKEVVLMMRKVEISFLCMTWLHTMVYNEIYSDDKIIWTNDASGFITFLFKES